MTFKRLNSKILFKSDQLTDNLARKAVSGGVTTMTAQVIQFLITTTSTIILARLLTPEDYGIIAMASVITGFFAMFKDAGLSMATIQQDKITPEQISTLFWINLMISSVLALITLALSPLVGWFYHRPELVPVTAFLSINLAINGLTLQHNALLRRHLMFKAQRSILILSQLISIISTIIMAYNGLRYWSLVWGTMVGSLLNIFLTYYYCNWIPGKMQKGTGIRKMLTFGGHLTGFNIVNYFSRNADNILIGKFLGSDALGLYSKAYALFMMPITQIRSPINSVFMPVLSSIKNDPDKYRNYYKYVIFVISILTLPVSTYLFIFADNIIIFVLGKKWIGAVEVFRILSIIGFYQSVVQAGRGLPLLSMGYSKKYFQFGLLQSIVTIIGMTIGLNWGIVGVAVGYGVAFTLLIPFTFSWSLKDSPVKVEDWLKAIYNPLIASLFMLIALKITKTLLTNNNETLHLSNIENLKILALGGIVGIIIYGVILLSFPVARTQIIAIYSQIKYNKSSKHSLRSFQSKV